MVDSEYSTDNCTSSTINIGAVIQNPEMRSWPPQTKRMFKQEVKELPFVITYVLDQYKTQEMYDKAILENGGILESLPDCYKNQKNVQ